MPKELAGIVRYVTDALDGDGGVGAEATVYANRRHSASRTFDEMLAVDALYDPESAGFHRTALRIAHEHDRRSDETRSLVQRNADTMTIIMRQWLELSDANTPDQVRRHAVFVLDLEDSAGHRSRAHRARRVRNADRDGHLSAATLDRIACDGNISRVVMYGKSEVLDVGRSSRTATAAPNSGRSSHATATAGRRDATNRPSVAKRTTSGIGNRPATVRLISTISNCCVGTTTANDISKKPKPAASTTGLSDP